MSVTSDMVLGHGLSRFLAPEIPHQSNRSISEVRSLMNYFTYKIKSDPTTPPVTHNENMATTPQNNDADALIKSQDPKHPANLICSLCRQFYTFGWVTGTGGGVSIKHEDHIFLAPSGVEKELMQPDNIFVMDYASKEYIRRPLVGSRQKEEVIEKNTPKSTHHAIRHDMT
jgi:hypothetical protein